jgi:hypothetical protein
MQEGDEPPKYPIVFCIWNLIAHTLVSFVD